MDNSTGDGPPATSPSAPEPESSPSAHRVTLRSVLVGAFFVALLAIINPYVQFLLQSWWVVGVGSLLTGPILALFILMVANTIIVRVYPTWAFTRTELLIVYAMGIVSLGFVGHGGLPYLASFVTYPFYMATPENDWEHLIWPHIPLWLRLGYAPAVDWFWHGLPERTPLPWRLWASPAIYWSLFTAALLGAMYCLGALVSKGWIERQRLTFPLVDVPLSMTGDAPRPTLATSLFRSRLLWIGFAIPFLVALIQWLHRFFPNVPELNLYRIHIGKSFVGMGLPWSVLGETHFTILFDVLGVMCLIPSEVSLSIWFFYLLYKLQLLAWASFGVAEGGRNAFINPPTFIAFEETGGYVALALFLLYESRNVIKRALSFSRRREAPDAYEPLAGRSTLIGFLLANAFMLWFVLRAGMSWWAFLAFMGLFYAFAIGASRLVAAGGVMFVSQDATNRAVVVRALGARPLGPASLLMYAYIGGIYMNDPYNLAMPQMLNSFKLVRTARISGRSLTAVSAVAVVVMLAVGVPAMIAMIHTHGGTMLGDWPFSMWGRSHFGEVATSLRFPEPPDNWLRLALLLGAGFMVGLSWLHTSIVGWPVSPIGFLIASAWATNSNLWSCALIGWLVVTVIKRYGGLPLYRSLRPAFLGLILGDYLGNGLFGLLNTIIDYRRMLA